MICIHSFRTGAGGCVIRKNRTGGPGTTQDQHKNKREEDQRGDGRDRRGTPTPRVRHPPKPPRNRTDQQGTPASSTQRPQTPVSPPRNPSEELHDTHPKMLVHPKSAKRSNHTRRPPITGSRTNRKGRRTALRAISKQQRENGS